MNLPASFHPDTGAGSAASIASSPSLSSSVSTSSTTSSLFEDKDHGLMGSRSPEDRFRSLTDLKWGEFEAMGFANVGADDKKLQFDLTEGARAVSASVTLLYTLKNAVLIGLAIAYHPPRLPIVRPAQQSVQHYRGRISLPQDSLAQTLHCTPLFNSARRSQIPSTHGRHSLLSFIVN